MKSSKKSLKLTDSQIDALYDACVEIFNTLPAGLMTDKGFEELFVKVANTAETVVNKHNKSK